MHNPTIGRIVIYRTDGRNGLVYDLPAIITCTKDSHPGDYPDGRKNGLPVPESDSHVHLTVFSPGGFGTTIQGVTDAVDSDFVGAATFTPGSGTYVEHNVPLSGPTEIDSRSWRWPEHI